MCVGGMGHAISIATGIASQTKKNNCFDGDSITMHLGSLATSSQFNNIIYLFLTISHTSQLVDTIRLVNILFF